MVGCIKLKCPFFISRSPQDSKKCEDAAILPTACAVSSLLKEELTVNATLPNPSTKSAALGNE